MTKSRELVAYDGYTAVVLLAQDALVYFRDRGRSAQQTDLNYSI